MGVLHLDRWTPSYAAETAHENERIIPTMSHGASDRDCEPRDGRPHPPSKARRASDGPGVAEIALDPADPAFLACLLAHHPIHPDHTLAPGTGDPMGDELAAQIALAPVMSTVPISAIVIAVLP